MRWNERKIALLHDRFTTAPVNRMEGIDFILFLVPPMHCLFTNVCHERRTEAVGRSESPRWKS